MNHDDELRRELESLQRRVYDLSRKLAGGLGSTEARFEWVPNRLVRLLCCRVGRQDFALPLEAVAEVVPAARLTPLVEGPAWVPGLLNLRGDAVPVLDVAARMARTTRTLALTDQIIVTSANTSPVGLAVQAVTGVESLRLPEQPVRERNVAGAHEIPHAPYLAAMLPLNDGLVGLLDVHRLIALSDVPTATPDAGEGAARA